MKVLSLGLVGLLIATPSLTAAVCNREWEEAGSTSLNCTTSSISVFADTGQRVFSSILMVLDIMCTNEDTGETQIETLKPQAKVILDRGMPWMNTMDHFLVNATNITCVLFGCTDLRIHTNSLINFPNASMHCLMNSTAGSSPVLLVSRTSSFSAYTGDSATSTIWPTKELIITPSLEDPRGMRYISLLAPAIIIFSIMLLMGACIVTRRNAKRQKMRAIRLGTWMREDSFDYNYAPINVNTKLSHSESTETVTEALLHESDSSQSPEVVTLESDDTTIVKSNGYVQSHAEGCEIPESDDTHSIANKSCYLHRLVDSNANTMTDEIGVPCDISSLTNSNTGAVQLHALESHHDKDQYIAYNANALDISPADSNLCLDMMDDSSLPEIPLAQSTSGGYIRNHHYY